eukprot:scaffold2508_cov37-Phaeocystis_antarctica.AAC.2
MATWNALYAVLDSIIYTRHHTLFLNLPSYRRHALEHPRKLLELQHTRAIRVPAIEERIDVLDWHVQPQHGHGLAELLLGDGAVFVLVPLPEEVDYAHRIGAQHASQLFLIWHTGILIEVDVAQRRAALCGSPPAQPRLVNGVVVLRAQVARELVDLEAAVLGGVPRVEE